MRSCQYLSVPACFFIAILSIAFVDASDLSPPAWRGQPGSTFQQWLFDFASAARSSGISSQCSKPSVNKTPWGQRAPPDSINNPYELTAGICVEFKTLWPVAEHVDWLESYNGRHGVWKLQSERTFANFLNFILPNAAIEDNASTTVHLQIIYSSPSDGPVTSIYYQDASGKPGNAAPDTGDLDNRLVDGWKQHIANFTISGCPRFESVFIYPAEKREIFIDSVTIDTICTANSREPLI